MKKEREKSETLTVELNNLKEKFSFQVLSDSLTGLPSRLVLEDRLSLILTQSMRYALTFALISLDIDEFKIINDVMGHEFGDSLLKEMANRLQNCVRKVDTVCRYSGDNFIILLPQITKTESIIYIAQRILLAIAEPFHIRDQDLFVTASAGIAIYPVDGSEENILLRSADSALNQAKMRGRNNYQFYRKEMHEFSRRELMLNSCLRNPEVFKEFELYYQPQINLTTKKAVGIEVILQWQHPDFGLIDTEEFMRVMEHSGKMLEIGDWILHKALVQFKEWQIRGLPLEQLFLNISFKQLESSHFIYKISEILQELNLHPKQLVLAIYENTLFVKFDQVAKSLNMLKYLGVKIAIAHFGTSHLSLNNLKKISLDYLKIDSSLIGDIVENQESQEIVRLLTSIAKNLNFALISEEVKSIEQQKILAELGCYLIQGPLYGPLLLGEEVEKKIEII